MMALLLACTVQQPAAVPKTAPAEPVEAPAPAAVPSGSVEHFNRETGKRTVTVASELPESVRSVVIDGERVQVSRIETSAMGTGREIKRFDADGRLLDVTRSR